MIIDFLKELNPDFKNIDEVYNKALKEYNPEPDNRSEVMFIDSFDFDEIEFNEDLETRLSMYLSQKRTKVDWKNIDYYNRYIKTKEFNPWFTYAFQTNKDRISYEDAKVRFKIILERYNFIYEKLNSDQKDEFKLDFIDLLHGYKAKVLKSKHKKIIDDTIKELERKNQTNSRAKGKPGRKKAKIKDAKEYLKNIDAPETKEKFILFLQNEYKNPTPKEFAHLMYALNELGFINIDSNIVYKKSFEKVLSTEQEIGTESNFNRTYSSIDKRNNLVNSIKETIKKRQIDV
jgi:DNA primase large subunit